MVREVIRINGDVTRAAGQLHTFALAGLGMGRMPKKENYSCGMEVLTIAMAVLDAMVSWHGESMLNNI